MPDQDRSARLQELADIFHQAGTGQTNASHAAKLAQSFGFLGGLDKQLWAAVAERMLNMIEEIAREQIDKWIIEHGGGTGGLYAVDPNIAKLANPPPASTKE